MQTSTWKKVLCGAKTGKTLVWFKDSNTSLIADLCGEATYKIL